MEVTYIICNHNYEDYIETCLQSILDQTVPVNCVIIDDASTDESVKKIKDFLGKEKNSTLFSDGHLSYSYYEWTNFVLICLENNRGPSYARNIGIKFALNDNDIFCNFTEKDGIFAILDMDDWAEPTKTEALIPYFNNSDVGAVYADYITYDEETNNQTKVYKECFTRERLLQECIVHSGSFISAKALKDIKDQFGYYDENMRTCEDYDLWMRISEKYMIIHHPEFLTHVRVTPKNSTNTVSQEIWQNNYRRVFQKLKARNEHLSGQTR